MDPTAVISATLIIAGIIGQCLWKMTPNMTPKSLHYTCIDSLHLVKLQVENKSYLELTHLSYIENRAINDTAISLGD